MKTKRLLSICAGALSLTATLASAATHASSMMTRSAGTRPTPRFAPRTMTGTRQWWNDGDNDRDDRFRRFHNRTFIFLDAFGFPFLYPYPYYGYYAYDYYGYGYGDLSTVLEVQRRLARAGYYHGPIDGIMGPQTRRAIRAYERDHNMPAYGVIDRRLLATMGLG
jgi:putative peptidoglycan binding protein